MFILNYFSVTKYAELVNVIKRGDLRQIKIRLLTLSILRANRVQGPLLLEDLLVFDHRCKYLFFVFFQDLILFFGELKRLRGARKDGMLGDWDKKILLHQLVDILALSLNLCLAHILC